VRVSNTIQCKNGSLFTVTRDSRRPELGVFLNSSMSSIERLLYIRDPVLADKVSLAFLIVLLSLRTELHQSRTTRHFQ
jgi:hypothetical protein